MPTSAIHLANEIVARELRALWRVVRRRQPHPAAGPPIVLSREWITVRGRRVEVLRGDSGKLNHIRSFPRAAVVNGIRSVAMNDELQRRA